jgi:hypothetical protein
MEKTIDLHTFDDELRQRKTSVSEAKGADFDRDKYELARAGKKQVLKVSTRFVWSMPRKANSQSAASDWSA